MKPTATIFWAAAVLMPTFHTLSTCATVMRSMAPKALFSGSPKARTMPVTIGTRQATRAVVDGTKKERMKPQRMMPSTTREGDVPILESVTRAIRRSSPVCIMAAARKSAAPTRQKAGEEKPVSAMRSALLVPMSPWPSGCGESPTRTAMSAMMTPAETGNDTAPVAQVMTAKAMMPIMR